MSPRRMPQKWNAYTEVAQTNVPETDVGQTDVAKRDGCEVAETDDLKTDGR